MRTSLLLLVLITALAGPARVLAQQTAAAPSASARLALASAAAPEASSSTGAAPLRLACAKLEGQVVGIDGKPLIGATITVKGTEHLFITDGEGKYQLDVPIYQGQVLEVEAAGYTTREVSLSDCAVPVVGLEPAAGTRVKKGGKRAGQIVRFGTADMQ